MINSPRLTEYIVTYSLIENVCKSYTVFLQYLGTNLCSSQDAENPSIWKRE